MEMAMCLCENRKKKSEMRVVRWDTTCIFNCYRIRPMKTVKLFFLFSQRHPVIHIARKTLIGCNK